MAQKSLAEIDLSSLLKARRFFPSPTAWEDQVLYFLLVDRFSDGNEKGYRDLNGNVVSTGPTPLFRPADALNAVQNEADAAWRDLTDNVEPGAESQALTADRFPKFKALIEHDNSQLNERLMPAYVNTRFKEKVSS